MDCCSSIRRVCTTEAHVGFPDFSRNPITQSQNLKVFGTGQKGGHIYARRRNRSLVVAVADAEPSGCKYSSVGTPLEPSSPEGLFLSSILQNQRHLFRFALSEQLNELASNRDDSTAFASKNQSLDSMGFLRKRIAKIKENERQVAIEDVMYMSIVHKFSEVEVPMVPKLSKCMTGNRLQIWPSKCRELESIHSVEVQDLIREHVATILHMCEESSATDGLASTKIDRLHLGRIYAASVMYGYFLKSACSRRQLEMSLPSDLQSLRLGICPTVAELYQNRFQTLTRLDDQDAQVTSLCQESQNENLKTYLTGFDSASFQRCAQLKSKEAVNVIERHTWALFGDEKTGKVDSDNEVAVTLPSVERLVLEAVAFGSFLWDVERSVDSVYGLTEN